MVAHFVQRIETYRQNPVAEELLHPSDPRAQQVLAHQHAEHGRLGGVLVILPRQLRPGLIGVGAQKQPVIAPAGTNQQRQRVPFGLIDLIHPAARQFFIQFPGHEGQGKSIHRHDETSCLPRRRRVPPGSARFVMIAYPAQKYNSSCLPACTHTLKLQSTQRRGLVYENQTGGH